jgi:hypothetical protein
MTPVPDQDALTRLREVKGCGKSISRFMTHAGAFENAANQDCSACADLLIAAIARQVEAKTIERCAKVAGPPNKKYDDRFKNSGRSEAAIAIRSLPRLWSERSTPDA